jgi:broad specificity phosphatase PhoE
MKILFIRHGENAGGAFDCPVSPVTGHLSADGVFQAETLRTGLSRFAITHAFASPYGRAVQTAEIVLRGRDVKLQRLDFLREWLPNQKLSHKEFDRMAQHNHEIYAEEMWKTELGEGRFEMCERVCPPFLKELQTLGIHPRYGGFVLDPKAEQYSLAVFAHGGTLAVLLEFLLEVRTFPIHRFIFQLAAPALIELHEHNGVYYPQLTIPNIEYFMS